MRPHLSAEVAERASEPGANDSRAEWNLAIEKFEDDGSDLVRDRSVNEQP
jgi:hypothetical protein